MIDPEVARLRRLRDEALRVRQIARRLAVARWDIDDSLVRRGACAAWRIARVVSGKLIEHPYPRYQQGAGVAALIGHRLAAEWVALNSKDRSAGLAAYAAGLRSLSRLLGDARALTWSTDFSDALGRSQAEIGDLLQALAAEGAQVETRVPVRGPRTDAAPRTDTLVGELAQRLEGDWPYLAF